MLNQKILLTPRAIAPRKREEGARTDLGVVFEATVFGDFFDDLKKYYIGKARDSFDAFLLGQLPVAGAVKFQVPKYRGLVLIIGKEKQDCVILAISIEPEVEGAFNFRLHVSLPAVRDKMLELIVENFRVPITLEILETTPGMVFADSVAEEAARPPAEPPSAAQKPEKKKAAKKKGGKA